MVKLTVDEVKKIQIDILDYVSDFCQKNKINYWIDSGTLIGAIRHKGYIPWDDDIDIGMLRPDYEKFVENFNNVNQRYKLVCIENNEDFYAVFGKVIDTKTVLYEPDINGSKLNINIDIFIYDNAPDSDFRLSLMYKKRDFYRDVALFSRGNQILERDGFKKRFLKKVLHSICKPFSSKKLMKKMDLNCKRYSDVPTTRVGNFTAVTKMSCSKRVFNSFVDVEFEGKRYKAPVGYDEWLTSYYGDYMKLPPIEKRVTHHQYEAYMLEEGEIDNV